jgi:hypothetical protein
VRFGSKLEAAALALPDAVRLESRGPCLPSPNRDRGEENHASLGFLLFFFLPLALDGQSISNRALKHVTFKSNLRVENL